MNTNTGENEMTRTYWQAEIERHGQLDINFPKRGTRDEAIADAQTRMSLLSDRERSGATAFACEWIENDDGDVTNTGKVVEVK